MGGVDGYGGRSPSPVALRRGVAATGALQQPRPPARPCKHKIMCGRSGHDMRWQLQLQLSLSRLLNRLHTLSVSLPAKQTAIHRKQAAGKQGNV